MHAARGFLVWLYETGVFSHNESCFIFAVLITVRLDPVQVVSVVEDTHTVGVMTDSRPCQNDRLK